MADYRTMYTTLFNKITDAINLLQAAQVETEDIFVSQEQLDITLLDVPDKE